MSERDESSTATDTGDADLGLEDAESEGASTASEPGPPGPGSEPETGQSEAPGGTSQKDGKLRELLRQQFALQMENVIPKDVQRILDQLEDRLETLKQSREVELADKAYGRLRLMGRMLQASAEGSFPLPWKSAAAIAATVTYLVNPFNILPDILKGDGILDEALVLYLGYTVVEQDMVEFIRTHDLDAEEFGLESTQSLL